MRGEYNLRQKDAAQTRWFATMAKIWAVVGYCHACTVYAHDGRGDMALWIFAVAAHGQRIELAAVSGRAEALPRGS